MRIACVDLPALPLQLVWRQEPGLRAHAVVVIDEETPQGQVLWACERARAAGVRVGHRYAFALSLCAGLRARVVGRAQIVEVVDQLRAVLHRLSPRVEPGEPGTFWLDGEGLDRVFRDVAGARSGTAWAAAIRKALDALAVRGAIVVGFSRFAAHAIARATRLGIVVLAGEADERARAASVPLSRLDLDPKLAEALDRLGVARLGELIRLPGGGILERFGRDAHRLYQLAARACWDPLVPAAPPESPDERVLLDDEEADLERLMFVAKPPLDRLLFRLAARGRALTALHVELTQKHAVGRISLRVEQIKPATPTLDGRALLRLVHLRLGGAPLAAPINAIRVWADEVAATREQLALFAAKPRRDLRAADEAVARLRAELGDAAVVRGVLRDGHLPEASFAWEPVEHVVAAAPSPDRRADRPLVRRLLSRPKRLPGGGGRRSEGPADCDARPSLSEMRTPWPLVGDTSVQLTGPYVLSGGWWARELAREYHFAELSSGECWWVYYDRQRQCWFRQGAVE